MGTNEATSRAEGISTDRNGVSRGGSDALFSESVAGRRPSARTTPEEPRPLQGTLPGLPGRPLTRERRLHRSRVDVNRETRAAAFAKADERSTEHRATWDRRVQAWAVGSGSDPGTQRLVRIRRGTFPGEPWWSRLTCDCPNETTGRQVCWHKAAVVRHWQEGGTRSSDPGPTEAPFMFDE
jgi:hypothetical protein